MTGKLLALTMMGALLAGCGGGGGGGSSQSEADRLLASGAGSGTTAIGRLPSGRASYSGVGVFTPNDIVAANGARLDGTPATATEVLGDIADAAILTADASMEADFDTGRLSGELTDFVGADGGGYSGDVLIVGPSGATPNIRSDNGIAEVDVRLFGTITSDTPEDGSITITGNGSGGFGGETGEFVLIDTQSTAIGQGTTTPVGGFIIGERD